MSKRWVKSKLFKFGGMKKSIDLLNNDEAISLRKLSSRALEVDHKFSQVRGRWNGEKLMKEDV